MFPPELPEWQAHWLGLFWDLNSERQLTGFGAGPIPASAIRSEAERQEFGPTDAQMFTHCIKEMDRVFLSRMNKRDEAPSEAEPSPNAARDAFRAAFRGK